MCASAHEHSAVEDRQERIDQSVLGAWGEHHIERDLALDDLDVTQHHAGSAQAEVVPILLGPERHSVGQPSHARGRAHGRLEHHRAVEVAAFALDLVEGGDRPIAGGSIEHTTEHRRRIEPREAQPVDRAVGGHECRGMAVGEQRMVSDRR